MELVLYASTGSPDVVTPWLTPAMALFAIVFGGGGIAALLKVRHDKRMGVASQELAEDASRDSYWKNIIEAQTQALLEPLRVRLTEVEGEVKLLKAELATQRQKYWKSISYIRSLLTWISRHMPAEVPTPPPTPAELVDDI